MIGRIKMAVTGAFVTAIFYGLMIIKIVMF